MTCVTSVVTHLSEDLGHFQEERKGDRLSKRGYVGSPSLQGCSKRFYDKAAGSGTTEAYPCGTSQGGTRLRTKSETFFSSPMSRCLLAGMCKQDGDLHRLRRCGSRWARIYGHAPTEQERLPVHDYRVDSIRWMTPPVPCEEHSSADCLCGAAGLRQCLVSQHESRSVPGSTCPIRPSIRFPSVQS